MVSIAGKTRLLHSRDPLQMTGCGIEWNVDLQASVHVSESMYTTVERHYAHPNLILIDVQSTAMWQICSEQGSINGDQMIEQ